MTRGRGGETDPVPTPTLAPPPPQAPSTRAWTRALVVLVCLAIVGFWIYVFALGPEDNEESRVGDEGFRAAAEARCAAAQAEIAALPPAYTATSPQDRAVVLAQANAVVDAMVADLRAMTPTDERDRSLVGQWLDDYDAYAAARRAHQEKLARGEDPQFAVPAVGGAPLTRRMDAFAEVNDMSSCEVPLDV